MHRSPLNAPRREQRGRPWRPVLSPLLLTCALCSPSLAQAQGTGPPPVFLVSTSADVLTPDLLGVDDADLVRVEPGAPARTQRSAGHWLALAAFTPSDVDALARRPGLPPGHHGSLYFSILANEAGLQDGDVLVLGAGGVPQVAIGEQVLLDGLGVPGGNIDLDALAVDDQGRLLFSLQSNLAATALGDLSDGDVLRLEPDGLVSRYRSEAEIQQCFEAASGLGSAVVDVQALEWIAGELWAVTQGPSSHDGGAFTCGASPALVLDEAGLGLGGAELDALALAEPGADLARLVLSPQVAVPGEELHFDVAGGLPGGALLVLAGGYGGYIDAPWLPGIGAVFLDPADPWLGLALGGKGLPVLALDGSGSVGGSFWLPASSSGGPGPGGSGWTFQLLDPASLELSAPFRVRL